MATQNVVVLGGCVLDIISSASPLIPATSNPGYFNVPLRNQIYICLFLSYRNGLNASRRCGKKYRRSTDTTRDSNAAYCTNWWWRSRKNDSRTMQVLFNGIEKNLVIYLYFFLILLLEGYEWSCMFWGATERGLFCVDVEWWRATIRSCGLCHFCRLFVWTGIHSSTSPN